MKAMMLALIAASSLVSCASASGSVVNKEALENQIFAQLAVASKLNITTPRIVVVGSESSAKSAILSRLTGVSLPSNSGATTLCAIQLRTEPSDKYEGTVYTVTSEKGVPNTVLYERAKNPVELSKKISDAHKALTNGKFSTGEVHVEVKGPGLKNLIVVDTPGITPNGQYSKEIEDIATLKLKGSDVIGVGIMACGDDICNQAGYRLIAEKGKNGAAIGILSKPDICSSSAMVEVKKMFDGTDYAGPKWYSLQSIFKDLSMNTPKLDDTEIEKKTFGTDPWKSIYEKHQTQFGLENVLNAMKSKIIESYKESASIMISELLAKINEWDSDSRNSETTPLVELQTAVVNKIKQAMGDSMKADKDIVTVSKEIRNEGMKLSQQMRELNPLYRILKECMEEKEKATAPEITNGQASDDDTNSEVITTRKRISSFLKGIFGHKEKQEKGEDGDIDDDDMSTEFCSGNIVTKYITERDALANLMNDNAGRHDLINDYTGVVSQKLSDIANQWEAVAKDYKDKIVNLGVEATKNVIKKVLEQKITDAPTQDYLREAGDIAVKNLKAVIDNKFEYLVKLETEQFYINADDSEFSFLLEAYAAAVRKYLEHNTELADKVLRKINTQRIDADGDCGILLVPEIRNAMSNHVASKIDTEDNKNKVSREPINTKKAAKSIKGQGQTEGALLERPIDLFVRVSAYVHSATNRLMDNMVTMVNNIMFDRLHVKFLEVAGENSKPILELQNKAKNDRERRLKESTIQANTLITQIKQTCSSLNVS